jgi:cell division protein FtsL
MTDSIIVAVVGFIVTLFALIKPIIDLNGNITELKVSIDSFKASLDKLDSRITDHGKELDDVKVKIANHEARIQALEK